MYTEFLDIELINNNVSCKTSLEELVIYHLNLWFGLQSNF